MCRLADTRTYSDGATLRSSIRRSREFRILVSAGGRSLLVARAGRVRVLLEARHAVVDVAGVRVHGRHADRGEVVGEVVLGVVLGVLGAVAAPLLVLGAPGHEADEARAAARDAAEDLDEQQRNLVVLAAEGVVVVTCVKL